MSCHCLTSRFEVIKWSQANIKINASHFNNVGTNTWGKIMYAKDLPSTYLPIWFAVKIPFIIWLGILALPFTEKKLFIAKKKSNFFEKIRIFGKNPIFREQSDFSEKSGPFARKM